jgi:hypothetical protein
MEHVSCRAPHETSQACFDALFCPGFEFYKIGRPIKVNDNGVDRAGFDAIFLQLFEVPRIAIQCRMIALHKIFRIGNARMIG